MAQFILFLHDRTDAFAGLSGDEMMAIIKDYMAWTEKMKAEGRYVGGQKLTDEPGRVMGTKGGSVEIHDGPFAEAHEILGGYMTIEAADYDEACALAKTCPHLKYGRIEVRMIDAIE
ncbi:YciI family protein [Gimibacter soli]|uniref:YciI family protein n=1 Tax=Gimibacter soli TaxID=3024400 RepID=A0AAF0BKH9_9PROT|nr:YciI family protein [Gimibacter soli]WCL54299.1 YciI family protein [Gimibacter soli]